MKSKIFSSLILVGLFVFPFVGSAQLTDDASEEIRNALIVKISELLEIVKDLQAQLVLIQSRQNTETSFTKDLFAGTTDGEVLLLQRLLNKEGFIVSDTGPGSLGNETDYFGAKTQRAVRALQDKYALQILVPQGLVSGNGMVEEKTRVVLNSLLNGESVTSDSSVASLGAPVINSISPLSGKNGSTVTILGSNFDKDSNKVQTSFGVFDVPSADGKSLEFVLYSELFAEINISDEDLEDEFGGDDSTADLVAPETVESDIVPQAFPVPLTISNNSGISQTVLFYVEPNE